MVCIKTVGAFLLKSTCRISPVSNCGSSAHILLAVRIYLLRITAVFFVIVARSCFFKKANVFGLFSSSVRLLEFLF